MTGVQELTELTTGVNTPWAEQRAERVRISRLMLRKWKRETAYFDNVVTTDESWVYHYDPLMKQQSTQWIPKGAAPPKKICAQKSHLKVMIITFWDQCGLIYTHYCPAGQTVNTAYYEKVLTQLIQAHIPKKPPEYQGGRWKLHQGNARPDVSKRMPEFFAKKKIELVLHPPYLLDLAPCNFYLFLIMKKYLKGRRFKSRDKIVAAVQAILKKLLKNGFPDIMAKWARRWEKCIALGGDYFEGDHSV